MSFLSNQKLINTWLKSEKIDAFLEKSPANISYLTGYLSRDSLLLVSERANIYITDSRYTQEAKNSLTDQFKIEEINNLALSDLIIKLCKKFNFKRLGFEADYLSFSEYQKLNDKLKGTSELVPVYNLIEELRQTKKPDELDKIKKAADITIKAMGFIKDFISLGRKEIEIAGELERFIRYNGASGSSFDIIVASGLNSSFPHHIPGQRELRDNEPVLIDIGVEYLGYKSDLTRVFFLGKINLLLRKVYNIVLEAQKRAIDKIKPGVLAAEIDKASRSYIEQKGFGRYFSHSLGHGIGLQVHEAPRISQKSGRKLEEGMVFTVEPAIYLPGKFGIRIEDMVVVTRKGVEVISGSLNK